MTWRQRLLFAMVTGAAGGWLWMYVVADFQLKGSLTLLLVAFLVGTAAVLWRSRDRLTANVLTSHVALGALAHTAAAALVVAGDRLGDLGVLALQTNGLHFLLGLLGLGASSAAWVNARGRAEELPAAPPVAPSPGPPGSVDWDGLQHALVHDPRRLEQLQALQAIVAASTLDEARGLAISHAERLALQVTAAAKEAEEDDALSQAANLLEWGAQKLPELAEIDVSDLLMAKAIADIRAHHDRVERCFVNLADLRPIHPIDRDTANEKCDQRAEAAKAARPLLQQHDMRLSEELIAAHDELAAFKSVTGFQVVSMGDGHGYVTFEGNGRREALKRAFGDEPVQVEVRHYRFDDLATLQTIRRRVARVQRWKGLTDE